MIIKIEAVPKLIVEDGVEKVVMGANNQPVWDKERALITTKGGNYRRIVTLTDELAAEVAKVGEPMEAIIDKIETFMGQTLVTVTYTRPTALSGLGGCFVDVHITLKEY